MVLFAGTALVLRCWHLCSWVWTEDKTGGAQFRSTGTYQPLGTFVVISKLETCPVYFHIPNRYLSVFLHRKTRQFMQFTESNDQNLLTLASVNTKFDFYCKKIRFLVSHWIQSVWEYLLRITVEWTWTIAWWSSSAILIWWQLSGCMFISSFTHVRITSLTNNKFLFDSSINA